MTMISLAWYWHYCKVTDRHSQSALCAVEYSSNLEQSPSDRCMTLGLPQLCTCYCYLAASNARTSARMSRLDMPEDEAQKTGAQGVRLSLSQIAALTTASLSFISFLQRLQYNLCSSPFRTFALWTRY